MFLVSKHYSVAIVQDTKIHTFRINFMRLTTICIDCILCNTFKKGYISTQWGISLIIKEPRDNLIIINIVSKHNFIHPQLGDNLAFCLCGANKMARNCAPTFKSHALRPQKTTRRPTRWYYVPCRVPTHRHISIRHIITNSHSVNAQPVSGVFFFLVAG